MTETYLSMMIQSTTQANTISVSSQKIRNAAINRQSS